MTQQEINEWAIAIGFLVMGFLMNLLYERSRRLEHRISMFDERLAVIERPATKTQEPVSDYLNARAVPRMVNADLTAIAKRTDAKQFKNFSDFRKSMESEDVA